MSDIEAEQRSVARKLRLSEGLTHWCHEGRAQDTPIVLVHGATVPSWEFDLLVPPLLRRGFQTLRFDLYGHGASARPAGAYTLERFTRQLVEVLEAADIARPATLLGHSFGAAVVADVAARRPDLARELVLVAPMLDFSSTSRWAALFRSRVIGPLAMQLLGVPALVRRRRRRYASLGQPQFTARFIEQASEEGFARAIASMFRTDALADRSGQYAALHSFEGEILVVSGEHDVIVPPEHVARLRALLPAHRHLSLPAEHNLLLTHPEAVADALAAWRLSRDLDAA
jgi:pimeloyl-ACP methyl ester carboxylesterase